MRTTVLAVLCLIVSACGIKGPLELPQRSSPVPQKSLRAQPAPSAKASAPAAAQSAPAQSEPAAFEPAASPEKP